jgi:hypothetical protein
MRTVYTISGPTPECDVPEPVRTRNYQIHTCSHCGVRFLLITSDGKTFWKVQNEYLALWNDIRDELRAY